MAIANVFVGWLIFYDEHHRMIFDEQVLKDLKRNPYGRFILVQDYPEMKYSLVLFNIYTIPTAFANKNKLVAMGSRFVGAGRYRKPESGWHIEWGSMSCLKEFRYDRPPDKEEADHLLNLVSEAIAKNIKTENSN